MPHSSGGGFHGGGFHGGGFHGGGFHGHSNGGTYRAHRYSRFYFVGATRYVYYRHNRPHYIYSDANPSEAEPKKAWAPVVILFIMLVIPLIILLTQGIHIPKTLSTDYDTSIVVEDDGNVLSNDETARLRRTFASFQRTTGITPAFESTSWVYGMLWSYGLEDYAYSSYTTKFKDEKHWLIVYQGGSNWAFEGMQGNDTDDILTGQVTKKFNAAFYNNLTSHIGVADSLINAFDEITPTIMNPSFYVEEDIRAPIVFWTVITSVAFFFSVLRLVNSYRMQGAVKCPSEGSSLKQETPLKHCPYCDSVYHPELTKVCPHCGANLEEESHSQSFKAEEPNNQQDEFAIDPEQFKIDNDNY